MKYIAISFFSLLSLNSSAQFDPAADQPGSKAIPASSTAIKSWATSCTVTRGYQDISNHSLGFASVGNAESAIGAAGKNGVVSLGDGGVAILTFSEFISDGPGPDFVVFENSFNDSFLELAFVEVSSDSKNFFRFGGISNNQDTLQYDNAGELDASKIYNLAGKYRALQGTPFDLNELKNIEGLDITAISHVKIIDVIGSIQTEFASKDFNGRPINDPWPTPFASSGFDLDAVGIIDQQILGNSATDITNNILVFPNPVSELLFVQNLGDATETTDIYIRDLSGRTVLVLAEVLPGLTTVPVASLPSGSYFVCFQSKGKTDNYTFMKF